MGCTSAVFIFAFLIWSTFSCALSSISTTSGILTATTSGKLVQGALYSVGAHSDDRTLPAQGSFSYLLLKVSGFTERRTLWPDGDLYDPCLCPRTLATRNFPGKFLRDKYSLGAWRSAGHVIPDLSAQKGSVPPGCQLLGVWSTHDNFSSCSSRWGRTWPVWPSSRLHCQSSPLQITGFWEEWKANLLGTSGFLEGSPWRVTDVNWV